VGIGVGQPHGNSVLILDDGSGNFRAQWNAGPVHSFIGVQTIYVTAKRARNDQVTIDLNDLSPIPPPFLPRQGGRVVAEARVPISSLRIGRAVQNGSELSVRVNKPTTNRVQVFDQGGGAIQVQWNGGPIRSFTGVTTIVVQTGRARNDVITFNAPLLS
jgi:hypothetical protein